MKLGDREEGDAGLKKCVGFTDFLATGEWLLFANAELLGSSVVYRCVVF